MNILVYGLGALGTVYACLLKKQGHRVCGLDLPPVAEAVQQHGLQVSGIWGEYSAQLDIVATDPSELTKEKFDLVVLTVKSFNTAEAAQKIAQMISAQTLVVLVQNGYGNLETASQFIPKNQLVLSRVIFGAETLDLGRSKVTVIADNVVLGSPQKQIDAQVLADLAQVFDTAGIPTQASDQVLLLLWGKIIFNCALNPLGAILEVNYGKLAEMPETQKIMGQIIEEIFQLFKAMGQEALWPDAAAYQHDFYTKLIPPTVSHHPSMLQDIQRGRRTEIGALNGAVVALGQQYGVPTPVNATIVEIVKGKERLALEGRG